MKTPASLSSVIIVVDPEGFCPDPDSTFQDYPDPDHSLFTKQLNNRQILSVDNKTAVRFLKHFKDFLRKFLCTLIKDDLDRFTVNLQQLYSFSRQKGKIRIRIHNTGRNSFHLRP